MKFSSIVKSSLLSTNIKAETKEEAFKEIVSKFHIKHKNLALRKIIERESQSSTGIGGGCAIPHARLEDSMKSSFL
jgi:PTS system fructose-specific IIC component